MKKSLSIFLITLIIFVIIFTFLSNITLFTYPTEGGNAQKTLYILNYKMTLPKLSKNNAHTELHNVIIKKIRLVNNLIPEVNINTNISTSMTELIRVTDQLPVIKLFAYNNADIYKISGRLDINQYIIIIIMSILFSILILLIWLFIVSPLISNPKKGKLIFYSLRYRPDIDGLRAIAVSLVILFHFNDKVLHGGYVGVDVFFVISGYLITQIIYGEMKNNAFSFKNFYSRRIKRILPTFYIMLFFMIIIGADILPNGGDTTSLCDSIKSNLMFIYNFYLLNNGHGYFDNPENQQLLLHTWSLAVEEQFYMFFPLIMLFCIRRIKPLSIFKVILLLAIVSLGFSVCFSTYDKLYAYYMLPSRAFELLLGCLVAIYTHEGINESKGNWYNFFYKTSSWWAVLGLVLIFTSSIILSKSSTFPGWNGLIPTIGAALFIIAGSYNSTNFINKIIANRFLVFIGLISYALYIWHWPILALYHYENPGREISLKSSLMLGMIILFIAIVNYFLVEKQLKKSHISYKQSVVLILILPSLALLIGTMIVNSGLIAKSRQISLETQLPDDFCFANYAMGGCIFGDKHTKTNNNILLFGDSHAAAFGTFISELGIHNHFNLAIHTSHGCSPILDFNLPPGKCKDAAIGFTNLAKNYKTIIIAGVYSTDINFLRNFSATLSYLKKKGKNVIVMGDVPYYKDGSVSYILRRDILRDKFNLKYNLSGVDLTQQNSLINETIKKLVRQQGIYFFDFKDRVADKIRTYPFYDNYLLYADSGHLNPHGSYLLAKYIEDSKLEKELIAEVTK